jgi:hypothetical protein
MPMMAFDIFCSTTNLKSLYGGQYWEENVRNKLKWLYDLYWFLLELIEDFNHNEYFMLIQWF